MIDWLAISFALVIIAILVGIFAFMAWKINVSDPLTLANLTGKKDEANQVLDSEKKKKDKHGNDQSKKKRKEQKKPKRENKEDDQEQHTVKFKEPPTPTSEETDNEREESEQEPTTPQVVETSSKVRHRNRKKPGPATLPFSSASPAAPVEGILVNKDEKSPVTTRAQPIPHPKLATVTPKDEVELARQHQQQTKTQNKSTQGANKQPGPPPPPPIPVRRLVPTSNNTNQGGQKQQQLLHQHQEQPFTTVGGNRHKGGTPPNQQQNKSANAAASSSATTTTTTAAAAATVPAPLPQQQPPPAQNQHEVLPPRQAPPRQQKEIPSQLNGFNANSQPVKQSAAPPTKLADLVKALPSSQAVVTELMSALDASTLTSDELDIIMHKIANKQSVLNKDWSKLQHGQKVDPQAHIGQVLDESARAFDEDMKTNAMKRIQELTNECANDKRQINELLKDNKDKDLSIQVLHSQLTTIQHPQQQMQTFTAEFKKLSDENLQLKQRLAQQQQHFQQQQQQQQLSSMNLVNNSGTDPNNAQLRVISEQIKKLSVDNGNLEKQLKTKDLLLKEGQKEKDDLLRSNHQLLQKAQDSQKQLQLNEEKLLKELNETRTLHVNQLNDYKRRNEQLELEKEQLRRVEVIAPVQAAPVLSDEDREKIEQLTKENEQYKSKLTEIQNQENQLRQEIEQLKKNSEQEKTLNDELTATKSQLEALRVELDEAKSANDSTNAQEKQKDFLLELLDQDARNQLSNDTKDVDQWLSSYRQIFTSSTEAKKRALQGEATALKLENDQLHKNMTEVANQLQEIEQTVQSKEELLLVDLKSKDATLQSIRGENDQLTSEVKRLRGEIDRLQSAHDTAVNDNRALKLQIDERNLINANSSSTTAVSNVDDSTVSSSSDQPPSQS